MNANDILSRALLGILMMVLVATIATAQSQPSALAPILVEPYDGKEVVEEQIVWSWFMQSTAANGQEILCDLVLVEILEGQSAEEAMRLNPPVILRKNLTTSTWQTPATARSLLHGRRYTWQITAKVRRQGSDLFQTVSQSELWELTYHDPALAAGEEPGDASLLPSPDPLETDSGGVMVGDTLLPSGTGLPIDTTDEGTRAEDAPAEAPRPIEVSGQARYTFASENRRGNLSTAPPKFDRLQIEPKIKLFGVPLNLSLLVTTEENLRQSDLSRGAIGSQDVRSGLNFAVQQRVDEEIAELERQRDSASVDSLRAFVSSDSATIAERIAQLQHLQDDPGGEQDIEALRRLNLLTPEQQTMALFPSFGFGKVAPNFGSLLFNEVTINGGALEYNPGNLYVAGAVGKAQRQFDPSSVPQEVQSDSALLADPQLGSLEFFRNVYSARVGFGRRHGSYVALTGIYADDDAQSRSLQTIFNRPVARLVERLDSEGVVVGLDTIMQENRVVGRQRNYGFGGVGHWQGEELGLALDGEFNLMYFDDEINRSTQALVPLPRSLPGFLKSDSALTDFNFALRADWKLPEEEMGRLNIGLRYVGGGFRSVGVAGLRTDVLRADARYRTVMLDRQVRVGLNYSLEEAGYKDSSNTSRIGSLGGSLDLRFRGFPALSLAYQRHDQNLETGKRDTAQHSRTENAIEQLSATLAYLHQWDGGVRWSLFASAMVRDGSSQAQGDGFQPDSVGVFRTRILQVDNRVSLGPGLTLGVLGAYTGTQNHPVRSLTDSTGEIFTETLSEVTDNYSIDVSALVQPFNGLHLVVGAVTTYQKDIPQPAILGGYFSSRFELSDIGTIELRFDYRESVAPDLKATFPVERIGRIISSVRW